MDIGKLIDSVVGGQGTLVSVLLVIIYFMFKYFNDEKNKQDIKIDKMQEKLDENTATMLKILGENNGILQKLTSSISDLSEKIKTISNKK